MADATLIQGAKELAAARSGVAPGVAFSAGFDKGQANAQANLAAQAKARDAQDKAARDEYDAAMKYFTNFDLEAITNVDGGAIPNIRKQDLGIITAEMQKNKDLVARGAQMNSNSRSIGDTKGGQEANDLGAEGVANSAQLKRQVNMLGDIRTELIALQKSGTIAQLPGNMERMGNIQTILEGPWSMAEGALTFEDGTRLVDIKLPYSTDLGIDFMQYASDETQAMAKLTPQEYAKATTMLNEQQAKVNSFFKGEEGLDRLEVLVSDNYFEELNLGFGGINFDRNNKEEVEQARLKATELTLAAFAAGTKPDKNADGKATGVNNPAYADMKALQAEYLNTPPLNRAARYSPDDLVFTLGSKNQEVVLNKNGWFIETKQPSGIELKTKYDDVEDLLRRNSNLFN
tara:strand:- start:16 stop:1224 length:1209 start_codon:yes stop_codon:yes gene_type:complete